MLIQNTDGLMSLTKRDQNYSAYCYFIINFFGNILNFLFSFD